MHNRRACVVGSFGEEVSSVDSTNAVEERDGRSPLSDGNVECSLVSAVVVPQPGCQSAQRCTHHFRREPIAACKVESAVAENPHRAVGEEPIRTAAVFVGRACRHKNKARVALLRVGQKWARVADNDDVCVYKERVMARSDN
eukprot:6204979-Pleurochrysis_carterae.AAC.2